MSPEAFRYDPDFRSRIHPKDYHSPFCCRCQRNLDTSKAVAVTINEETFMALMGHGRAQEIRTNFNPGREDLCGDSWIGKDCLRKLNQKSL
jgi:hypothetical protein